MEKIKWCICIKNGLELAEPNENLSNAYLKKSEDALKAAASLKDNPDWEISSSYYAMYFALYSLLMKIGVKCENHSCTIEFMKEFLKKHFNQEDIDLMAKSMNARVDAQYYSNREISKEFYNKMVLSSPKFLAKCKEVALRINEDEINLIRDKMTSLIRACKKQEE